MSLRSVVRGLATYIPGLYRPWTRRTGGTGSARYCYSVWLRHLSAAHDAKLSTTPQAVAELGPGDSLGIGLAALLSGADRYYAFDVVRYAKSARNLGVLDELVDLFRGQAPIPHADEFPDVKPHLPSYDFPRHILTADRLQKSLRAERIAAIRLALLNLDSSPAGDIELGYVAPWYEESHIREAAVDMIYSQAVLEHVESPRAAYQVQMRWLRPGGYISHQIDFKCHGTARTWNGHWAYSDLLWKLIKGKRPYLLNREPHSTHVRLLQEMGLRIVTDVAFRQPSGLSRRQLAEKFRSMSEDDLTTSGAFIQAVKGL